MTWLWILTGLSLIGVVLNIKKLKVCFLVWAVTNITWAIVDFKAGLVAQGVLFVIYTGLAVYGFLAWRRR